MSPDLSPIEYLWRNLKTEKGQLESLPSLKGLRKNDKIFMPPPSSSNCKADIMRAQNGEIFTSKLHEDSVVWTGKQVQIIFK